MAKAPAARPATVLALVAFLLLLAAAALKAELTFPPLSGRVVDEAGLLTPAEEERLTQRLAAYEQASGNQVVVVTLKSLQGVPIEDYGYQLGRHWGIGQKDKNTGALLIVAPSERKVRIEVGYGLEGTLTDAASKLIIENVIVPAFKAGRYGPGIIAGTEAILKVLSGDAAAVVAAPRKRERRVSLGPLVPLLLIGLFWLVAGVGRRGRRGWLYGGLPWYGGGWGGHRRSGGFGGGGFSGGGGSFGGGGASGSW